MSEMNKQMHATSAPEKFATCYFGLYEIQQAARNDKNAVVSCKNFLKFADQNEFKKEFETCERYVNSQTY